MAPNQPASRTDANRTAAGGSSVRFPAPDLDRVLAGPEDTADAAGRSIRTSRKKRRFSERALAEAIETPTGRLITIPVLSAIGYPIEGDAVARAALTSGLVENNTRFSVYPCVVDVTTLENLTPAAFQALTLAIEAGTAPLPPCPPPGEKECGALLLWVSDKGGASLCEPDSADAATLRRFAGHLLSAIPTLSDVSRPCVPWEAAAAFKSGTWYCADGSGREEILDYISAAMAAVSGDTLSSEILTGPQGLIITLRDRNGGSVDSRIFSPADLLLPIPEIISLFSENTARAQLATKADPGELFAASAPAAVERKSFTLTVLQGGMSKGSDNPSVISNAAITPWDRASHSL